MKITETRGVGLFMAGRGMWEGCGRDIRREG